MPGEGTTSRPFNARCTGTVNPICSVRPAGTTHVASELDSTVAGTASASPKRHAASPLLTKPSPRTSTFVPPRTEPKPGDTLDTDTGACAWKLLSATSEVAAATTWSS